MKSIEELVQELILADIKHGGLYSISPSKLEHAWKIAKIMHNEAKLQQQKLGRPDVLKD